MSENMTAQEVLETVKNTAPIVLGGQQAKDMIIAALQASVPRVLTFNEIKSNLPRHLWIECNEPETLYPSIARECITIDGNDWMMFSEDGFGGDYGVGKLYCMTWRCWTNKPTQEQMSSTTWEVST